MGVSMRRILLLSFICFPATVSAITIPGGDVSGTWDIGASPYHIEGEITVPEGEVLVIDPGVEIVFGGHFKFQIRGQLLAVGTVQDSILFTAEDAVTGWHSLRFLDTVTTEQPASQLTFCRIEHGHAYGPCPDSSGGGVYMNHAALSMSHCLVVENRVSSGTGNWGGAGIFSDFSSPIIEDCEIAWNSTPGDGGGIYLYWSPATLVRNSIHDNTGNRGGGVVAFSYSSADITENLIQGNQGEGAVYLSGSAANLVNNRLLSNVGSGLACYLSDPFLAGNLIAGNSGAIRGGGIHLEGSSPTLHSCSVADNSASSEGGGIYATYVFIGVPYASNPVIRGSIFYGNTASSGTQISASTYCSASLYHDDIQDLAGDGVTGTIYDFEGNVDVLPLFEGSGDHPYSLLYESPCRNLGPPDAEPLGLPPLDLAGNPRVCEDRVDMGAYECQEESGTELSPESRVALAQNYPNPFNPETRIDFTLQVPGHCRIDVFSLSGRKVTTILDGHLEAGPGTVSWNGRDDSEAEMPSGIYLYRLSSMEFSTSRRMVLIR